MQGGEPNLAAVEGAAGFWVKNSRCEATDVKPYAAKTTQNHKYKTLNDRRSYASQNSMTLNPKPPMFPDLDDDLVLEFLRLWSSFAAIVG